MPERLMVIDGNSLMHRAFYALPDMTTSAGLHTNAVLGFVNMLLKAVADFAPTHLVVAFDRQEPTFRHIEYQAYKAGRRETPETLWPQFTLLRDLLCAMGVAVADAAGYEADDLLGSYAAQAKSRGMEAYLVTGDRDALQLIGNGTIVLLTRKGLSEIEQLDTEALKRSFGVAPSQVIDLKGLMGDSSDNLPGVPGVGEKTALKLLAEYETLDSVLEHAKEIKGKLGEKLTAYADDARMCRRLATIRTNAPLSTAIADSRVRPFGTPEAMEMLARLEMNSVRRRLAGPDGASPPAAGIIGEASAAAAVVSSRNVTVVTDDETLERIGRESAAPIAVALTKEGVSAAFEDGTSFDAGFGGDLLTPGVSPEATARALSAMFKRYPNARAAVFDKKTLLFRSEACGATLPAECLDYDVMLAAYLLDAVDAPELASVSIKWLGEPRSDADALLALRGATEKNLAKEGLCGLFSDMEMPLCDVLLGMERTGFLIDKVTLGQIGDDMRRDSESLRKEIVALAGGYDFNPNSTKQLAEVLFDRLMLPVVKKTSTGRSTDSEVLEKLEDIHPIAGKVAEYRHVMKLLGTYVDGLFAVAGGDGRVHTTFHQALTSTGRISSSEPNLQNIPVRTELGRSIRRAFVAPAGCVLLDADYSQIELRVLAHMSGDPAFVDAFIAGQDIHRRTASEVFGVPLADVTASQRSAAKAVNFGIVYGISDFGLARNIGSSRQEAADIIKRFFARYPHVKNAMDGFIEKARADGCATTLFGRKRRIPDIDSKNFNRRSFAERTAMNTPIQGTSADIIKIAMIRVVDALKPKKSQLILQVHDELIVEAPEDEREVASVLLRECMENVTTLKVPLIAEVSAGRNWAESK